MDELDKTITKIVSKKINTPKEYHEAIQNTFNTKQNEVKHNWIKTVSATCAGVILFAGIAFAGYKTYEQKVWKEPEIYTNEKAYEKSLNTEIKAKISKEDAKNEAITFLNNLGYKNVNISKIELKKSYNGIDNSYYMIKTQNDYEKGLMVLVNSDNGKTTYFEDLELKYKSINEDTISKEEAKKYAFKIYDSLDINKDNYELESVDYERAIFRNKERGIWGASFIKKGEIYNKYNKISFSFIVSDKKIFLDTVSTNIYGNDIDNPVIIDKEMAINIAENKEKEFTSVEITKINAELAVERMNTFVYQLENDMYNDNSDNQIYLKIDTKFRKVWKVVLEHNKKNEENIYSSYNKFMKENYDKEYYIDATTGEIIGGKYIFNNIRR